MGLPSIDKPALIVLWQHQIGLSIHQAYYTQGASRTRTACPSTGNANQLNIKGKYYMHKN